MPLARKPITDPVFEAINLELVPGTGGADLQEVARVSREVICSARSDSR